MSADQPSWPEDVPDAATLIRYFIAHGQFCLGLGWGYIKRDACRAGAPLLLTEQYLSSVGQMQHAHDMVAALQALAAVNPQAADDLAGRIWVAADCGDSYGELLWQWATEVGLDPDAIHKAGVDATAKDRP